MKSNVVYKCFKLNAKKTTFLTMQQMLFIVMYKIALFGTSKL